MQSSYQLLRQQSTFLHCGCVSVAQQQFLESGSGGEEQHGKHGAIASALLHIASAFVVYVRTHRKCIFSLSDNRDATKMPYTT